MLAGKAARAWKSVKGKIKPGLFAGFSGQLIRITKTFA